MQRVVKDHGNQALHSKLKTVWFPYSLSKPALIDTIFLKAANSLAVKTAKDSRQRWDLIACAYKQKCLRNAIEAIEREGDNPMDETVALILSIAADDVSLFVQNLRRFCQID